MDTTFLPGPTSCRFCCFFCPVATPAARSLPRPSGARCQPFTASANGMPARLAEFWRATWWKLAGNPRRCKLSADST